MNLVRLGHYFTPNSSEGEPISGYCQTALVVGPGDVAELTDSDTIEVNLAVWSHDGSLEVRREVRYDPASPAGEATFHLSGDCVWGR